MGTSDGRPQEVEMTVEQAAEIIQKLYQESAPEIDNGELRIGDDGRTALQVALKCMAKAICKPAVHTPIFEGPRAEKLKAIGATNFETRKCPECNWIVADRRFNGQMSVKPFCEHCGQAIIPE